MWNSKFTKSYASRFICLFPFFDIASWSFKSPRPRQSVDITNERIRKKKLALELEIAMNIDNGPSSPPLGDHDNGESAQIFRRQEPLKMKSSVETNASQATCSSSKKKAWRKPEVSVWFSTDQQF